MDAISITLHYKRGLEDATSESDWHAPETWTNIVWSDSADITQNSLAFNCLVAKGDEHLFEGIVKARLVIQHGSTTIREFFQVVRATSNYIIDQNKYSRVVLSAQCVTITDDDTALDFLRNTFPAQVYDISKDMDYLGRQTEWLPILGGLLDTQYTIETIERPADGTAYLPQLLAYLLARCIPRLLQYDKEAGQIGANASGITLNQDANVGHLLSAFIGDILWESEKWDSTHKLLDDWGFGVRWVHLTHEQLNRKYGQQVFTLTDSEYLTDNPKLLAQTNRPDAQVGDYKYLDDDLAQRFSKQPVPILYNPFYYDPNEILPTIEPLTIRKDVPDITQYYNSFYGDNPLYINENSSYAPRSITPFWDIVTSRTQVIGDNNALLQPAFTTAGQDPALFPAPNYTLYDSRYEKFMLNNNPFDDAQSNTDKAKYGYFNFEHHVDGVSNSPYLEDIYPNQSYREVAIAVSKAKRKTRSATYTLTAVPVFPYRAGNRIRLTTDPEANAIMHITKATHRFAAGGRINVEIQAHRLNPDPRGSHDG